jgi:hypothetical protein
VLAALPIALTGNQVLAAGSAGAAAAQSASSGGAGAGYSIIAGIATFFWTLLSMMYVFLFYMSPFILGCWSGIRNAPTLRARQWMLKVTAGYIIAGSLSFMLPLLLWLGVRNAKTELLQNFFSVAIYAFLVGFLPGLVIVSSYLINRRWRKIVEEDTAQQDCTEIATPNDFLRSMYRWVGTALFCSLLAIIIPGIIGSYLRYGNVWGLDVWYLCLGLVILAVGLPFFYFCMRISKDQESFAKYPPRLPNLLAILTGEEKAPRGFLNRINFWGDTVGIGCGLFFVQVIQISMFIGGGTESVKFFGVPVSQLWLLLILLAYFLFALFFAGIPRRRYWGMIVLGVSVFAINSIICLMLFETLIGTRFLAFCGLATWYWLCFTFFVGVAGLYAFRKKAAES